MISVKDEIRNKVDIFSLKKKILLVKKHTKGFVFSIESAHPRPGKNYFVYFNNGSSHWVHDDEIITEKEYNRDINIDKLL